MGAIYRITHKASGTTYVGSTANIKRRWPAHRHSLQRGSHHNPHLQFVWNKYGTEAFEWVVVEERIESRDLATREQFWLDEYRRRGEVYNYGTIADSNRRGIALSEQTKRKMSKARMGRIVSQETRRKISKALMGHDVSERARRKMGEAHKGELHPLWGKHRSEETKRKIGMTNAGPYPSLVHRETGEVIPAGLNLTSLCRERVLNRRNMWSVIHGQRKHHKGWVLANNR